jgi:hypothetical protein
MAHRTGIRAAVTALLAVVCVLAPAVGLARGGLNFGFKLGGAMVSGETGLEAGDFDPAWGGCQFGDECYTEQAGGFAFGLRFGYNVLGYGGVDLEFFGHGNTDSGGGKAEGAVYGSILGSVCPLQFFEQLRLRKYDASLYFGYSPVTYMGYHVSHSDHDGRGWSGTDFQFGTTFDYDVGRGVSVGLDLKFLFPQYKTYIYNWDDDITFEPKSTPSTFVFAPLATITFHMLDPEEK